MSYPSDLRKVLYETYDMLRCAYGDALVPKDEYWALAHLLYEGMSYRPLSQILTYFTGKTYDELFTGSILGLDSEPPPSAEELEIVRPKLEACGYQEWVAKNQLPPLV